MKIDFQIVHSVNYHIKEYLLDIFKQTIDASTIIDYTIEEKPENLEDWSIFDTIEIKYNYEIGENKIIVGFSLEIEENLIEVVKEFGDALNDDENIKVVFKYFDEVMFRDHKNIVEEIFALEMMLREILTFVFIDTYKEEYYDLLKEIDIRIQPINKNNRPTEEYFKKYSENEFFFLLFSDYIRLNNLKKIGQSDLIDMITNSNNYNELKQHIQNRGIVKEKYQDLIASIKQNLEAIENMRNCVAHNRSFTDTILENYQQAKTNLERIIEEFWRGLES